MFFDVTTWRWVRVQPEHLGPGYSEHIKELLRQDVEGGVDKKFGACIAVILDTVKPLERGKVQDGTGIILVKVRFKAIYFKPYKNEVIYAKVDKCDKLGFLSIFGPLKIFVSRSSMDRAWEFDDKGGLDKAEYLNQKTKGYLREGSVVCVRLVGTRLDAGGECSYHAVGSINDQYLGPLIDDS